METLQIKRLSPTARLPERATGDSVGYDLFADLSEPVTVGPGETVLTGTGIAAALQPGTVGLIFARSGLGVRHGIIPANAVGVIDPDYRGEWKVGLYNHSRQPYTIRPGDRIAQLVIVPVLLPQWEEADSLPPSARDSGGWGSTGR